MSLILHIDTAVDAASICLSEDERVLAVAQSDQVRDSAGWLQPAIHIMMQEAGVPLQKLQAVSVSAGPGSYTGLRVGMASAKGLCYALNLPLLTVVTLQAMAAAAQQQIHNSRVLYCPLIDARRMEVFTAVYDANLQPVLHPVNLVVQEDSFDEWLSLNKICFFGNGSEKLKGLVRHENAEFISVRTDATSQVALAVAQFRQQQFAPLAYTEPLYVKAFYSTQR